MAGPSGGAAGGAAAFVDHRVPVVGGRAGAGGFAVVGHPGAEGLPGFAAGAAALGAGEDGGDGVDDVVGRQGEAPVEADDPAAVVGRAAGDEDGAVVGEDEPGEAVGEQLVEPLVEAAPVGEGASLEVDLGVDFGIDLGLGLAAGRGHLEEGELFGRRHRG